MSYVKITHIISFRDSLPKQYHKDSLSVAKWCLLWPFLGLVFGLIFLGQNLSPNATKLDPCHYFFAVLATSDF